MILKETLLLVIVGLMIGLPCAVAAARLASSFLFGLRPSDPPTLAAAGFMMLAVALLAGFLPARRATKVDPMVALRYE